MLQRYSASGNSQQVIYSLAAMKIHQSPTFHNSICCQKYFLTSVKIFYHYQGPQPYEVEAGDTATFRCNAVADTDLNLDINWLKDGRKIEFDTEPRFIQVIIIILISSQVNTKSVGRSRAKGQKVETATASSFGLGVGGGIFLQLERVSISYFQHRQSSIQPDIKDKL